MIPTAFQPPPTSAFQRAKDEGRTKLIGRTTTGIGFLIVAVLLLWIPVVNLVGLVLGALGVIFLARGADVFGYRHTLSVWISILIYVISDVAFFVLGANFQGTVGSIPSTASGPAVTQTILNAFDVFLDGALVVTALATVSFVLIVFFLEDRTGRFILFAAAGVQIAISVLLFIFVLSPLIHQTITQAFAANPPDLGAVAAADQQIRGFTAYTALNAIPVVIFAVAYYHAFHRVDWGEIPPPPKPSPAPPAPES